LLTPADKELKSKSEKVTGNPSISPEVASVTIHPSLGVTKLPSNGGPTA